MKKIFKILGVGEILWDVFPNGKKLGGAPTNFAYHVSALGHEGIVVRSDEAFHYQDFHKRVCKLVRPDFLAGGGQHWRFKKIEVNGLK